MRVLLLSAYDAGSHRYWRKGLVANLSDIDFTVLTLPPRYFSWRIRGNPLSWFAEQKLLLQQPYDLLIATSMVDLATLKGLVANLAKTPSLVYFHENQFAYPESPQQKSSLEVQICSIYNGLAADAVVFNSAYNRDTYLQGVKQLLTKLPDHAPLSIVDDITQKCHLLPVPIDDAYFISSKKPSPRPLTLVWNHRWQYDKAPERLFAALKLLADKNIDFRLHLLGEQFRNLPPVFAQIKTTFAKQLLTFGYVEDIAVYRQILASSDVVISTAIHEFQGLSMLKATASACIPVVPKRLVYPEIFPRHCCYQSCTDINEEAQHLAKHLAELATKQRNSSLKPAPDVSSYAWRGMRLHYQQLISQIAGKL